MWTTIAVYQDDPFNESVNIALDHITNQLSSSIVEVEMINQSREAQLCNHTNHSANPGSSNETLESTI
jgi:hypothetical protein